MSNYHFKIFCEKILKSSESDDLSEALREWECVAHYEANSQCICNHKIATGYVILNKVNGNKLEPIGSDCIKRISRECNYYEICNEMNKIREVRCLSCDQTFITNMSYIRHTETEKHKRNIDSRKCLGCDNRILSNEPVWKTRCVSCYRKLKE